MEKRERKRNFRRNSILKEIAADILFFEKM